jgi:flagellar hook-associated protein 1 FlgK
VAAADIAALLTRRVTISRTGESGVSQSLLNYYATLVTRVGSDVSQTRTASSREAVLAQNLYERREEIVGVNLDEEMSNLVRFQSSYKAAAKLITTADEMLQTVLGMKQ